MHEPAKAGPTLLQCSTPSSLREGLVLRLKVVEDLDGIVDLDARA